LTNVPWEFSTEQDALLALAGDFPREVYLDDRNSRTAELRERLKLKASDKVFEIGSGDGMVAKLLSALCRSIDCADISESFLASAKAECKGIRNIKFHRIPGRSLKFLPSGSYDCGFSLNVFIHLNPHDMYLYFSEVMRVLKPGGLFYFDACTLGPQTLDVFRQQVSIYAETLDARGLLNFNHPQLISTLATEVGLTVSDDSAVSTEGWSGFVLVKPVN